MEAPEILSMRFPDTCSVSCWSTPRNGIKRRRDKADCPASIGTRHNPRKVFARSPNPVDFVDGP